MKSARWLAISVAGVCWVGRFDTGLPTPGIAAFGSFSCAGSVLVKPSLTKMIDLRPSRMPPSRTAAPFSAPIVTWLRTRSTVCTG